MIRQAPYVFPQDHVSHLEWQLGRPPNNRCSNELCFWSDMAFLPTTPVLLISIDRQYGFRQWAGYHGQSPARATACFACLLQKTTSHGIHLQDWSFFSGNTKGPTSLVVFSYFSLTNFCNQLSETCTTREIPRRVAQVASDPQGGVSRHWFVNDPRCFLQTGNQYCRSDSSACLYLECHFLWYWLNHSFVSACFLSR